MPNSNNKKQIFLHIGFGKTGTSAFQKMMLQNKERLIKNGVMYPEIGLYGAAHHNLSCLLSVSGPSINYITSNILEINTIFLASECNKLVLSSENFIYTKQEIIRLYKKLFDKFDVKIIIYIRKQEIFIESTFLEWVKNGWNYCNDIDNFVKEKRNGLDFTSLIKPWEDNFGEDNLIVKLYDKRLIKDICKNMLEVIGIKEKNMVLHGSDINSSLLPSLFSITHEINCLNLDINQRQCIIDELILLSNKYRNFFKESIISRKLSDKIIKQYSKGNEALANKYLTKEEKKYFLG